MPKIKVEPRGIIERYEVDSMIQKAKNVRDKALISMLYIFGFRISEIIKLRRGHEVKIYPLEEPDGELILEVQHEPSKKRTRSGIIASHKIYIELEKVIYKEHIARQYMNTEDGAKLFPITRQGAWKIIKKLNPNTWCHLFRHTRATKMVESGMTLTDLLTWFDWEDSNTGQRYIKRRPITGVTGKIK